MVPLASPATSISRPVARAGAAKRVKKAESLSIGGHLDADHPVGVRGRLATGDGVHMFHSIDDAAIDRVLPVEEMIVREADEELAVGAVGVLTARGTQRAAIMGHTRELGLEIGQVAAAGAGHADVEIVLH